MDKTTRQRFGKTGQPIPATKAYVRDLANFDPALQARSWMLINETTQTVTFVNTYKGGQAGRDYDPGVNTFDLSKLDQKKHQKRMRNYTEVPVSECSVAVEAGATVAEEATV
jgi:hypothetical protein